MATAIDPYELMGVDRLSPPDEVRREARRAFHRMARIVHPDVGGTAADLRVVAEAFEVLTGETAPPTELTLRALCARLLGFDAEPTVAHDVVCMRLFALGDATLEAGFDVDAFVDAELALACPGQERPSKRARLDPPPLRVEDLVAGLVRAPDDRDERYAAMLAERGRLLTTPAFDDRYAALVAERERDERHAAMVAERERMIPPTLDELYAALVAEREQLLNTPTFDERYAALVAERDQR